MHPFVHLSIGFWLYTALQCRSSMSSNCLAFHTSGGISSSSAAFLILIFRSRVLRGWMVLVWCLYCLLIIPVISSCVTFGGFPSKFWKRFHRCIRFCWLVAFSLAFAVLFLLLTSFTVCHAILDFLSSTESQILSIWFCNHVKPYNCVKKRLMKCIKKKLHPVLNKSWKQKTTKLKIYGHLPPIS